jgi:hypothetical protein
MPQTPQGRLFFYIPLAETITAINFAFQVWDFFVSLFIPEYCTAIMLTHHMLAAMASGSALSSGILGYYAIFFLGLVELNLVSVMWVKLAIFFPPEEGTFFYGFSHVMAAVFVIHFMYYRVLLWWPYSYQLWNDTYQVISSGQAQRLRPGYTWVLYLSCAFTIPFGLLQLYWSKNIILTTHKELILPILKFSTKLIAG